MFFQGELFLQFSLVSIFDMKRLLASQYQQLPERYIFEQLLLELILHFFLGISLDLREGHDVFQIIQMVTFVEIKSRL